MEKIKNSRRSFVTSGIILTLANRSAFGSNACVGSGFQSHAATTNTNTNISSSHHYTTTSSNLEWKHPSSLTNGWHQTYQSWQAPLLAATRVNNRWKIYDGSSWTGPMSKFDILLLYPTSIIFVNQLGDGFTSEESIYDVVGGTDIFAAYQIASKLNTSYVKNPVQFPQLATIYEYDLFYKECVNP